MNRCALCDRLVDADRIVAVRGLADAPGVVFVCRDDLDAVLRRGRLHPPAPTLREELGSIFPEEDPA